MKKLLSFVVMMAIMFALQSQNIIFQTGFDDAPLGAPVAQSYSDWWTTWNDTPGGADDGVISDEQAQSPPHSAKVVWGDDIVFKAGDRTSGAYIFDFDMFLPNGLPAYFNILHHFAGASSQWALGVYFNITSSQVGVGTYVRHNGQRTNFTPPPANTWFPVSIFIDLDNDIANIKINGTEILEWQFSIKEDGGQGLRQLGVVSYWPPQTGARFYIDNFVFTQVAEDGAANMNVTPTSISEWTPEGNANIVKPITITNTGNSMGDYSSWIRFDELIDDGDIQDFTLTYSSDDVWYMVGYNVTEPREVELAVKFPTSYFCEMIGTYVTRMSYFLPPFEVGGNRLTFRIYGSNVGGRPGALLAETSLNNVYLGEWNEVTLSEPFLLDGAEIWLAVTFTHLVVADDYYPIATDDQTAVPGVNFIRLGTGSWSELVSSNPATAYGNIMIKGETQGIVTPACWLSLVGNTSGNVPMGSTRTFNATFNATGLEVGTYRANLFVTTSDENNPLFEIPCTLQITEVGIETYTVNNIQTTVYPNPASDMVTIESNKNINSIQLFNNMGQIVYSSVVNGEKTTVNTANFGKGIYFLKVNTDAGTKNIKIAVQ